MTIGRSSHGCAVVHARDDKEYLVVAGGDVWKHVFSIRYNKSKCFGNSGNLHKKPLKLESLVRHVKFLVKILETLKLG
jgi:hypothetical protein